VDDQVSGACTCARWLCTDRFVSVSTISMHSSSIEELIRRRAASTSALPSSAISVRSAVVNTSRRTQTAN